ncbi:MAG TPA: response regulator [Candidatus Saccharimonadales bacterium]|nr:response regulator [Candidatus Saccharimonadales bacterium]
MPAKIMLVEDDTNLSEIYQARLEAEGFAIISAKDGEEALALAVKEHPDLIISDVMMPKISGFDMLDILRGTDSIKNTKIIMMTALGQAEDKARADKLGADRYLVKSQVTLEDVVKAVHEVLEDDVARDESVEAVAVSTPSSATPPDNTTTAPVDPAPQPDSGTSTPSQNITAPTDTADQGQSTTTDEKSNIMSQIQSFADKSATPLGNTTTAPVDPAPSNDKSIDEENIPVTTTSSTDAPSPTSTVSDPINPHNSSFSSTNPGRIINDITPLPQTTVTNDDSSSDKTNVL